MNLSFVPTANNKVDNTQKARKKPRVKKETRIKIVKNDVYGECKTRYLILLDKLSISLPSPYYKI